MAADYKDVVANAENVLTKAQGTVEKVIETARERRLRHDVEEVQEALRNVDHALAIMRAIKERPVGGLLNFAMRAGSSEASESS